MKKNKIVTDTLSYSNDEEIMKRENEEEVLEKMRDRFNYCTTIFTPMHEEMRLDYRFHKGDQWIDEKTRMERIASGRPCESFNIINQYTDRIISSVRQNPPSIDVKSSDFNTNKITVAVCSAFVKKVEKESYAARCYVKAMQNTAICGLGGLKLSVKYKNSNSFKKKLKIESISSPFNFYFDPNFDDNFENMEYGFLFDKLTIEEFKSAYPEYDLGDLDSLKMRYNLKQTDKIWIGKDEILIAEYYYKERTEDTLYLLENGSSVYKSFYDRNAMIDKIIKKRKVYKTNVKQIITNGFEILEETVLPFEFIPIIPCLGNYLYVDNEISFQGVVRQLQGVQTAYNYIKNKELEMVSSMSIGKVAVEAGTLEGHEQHWNNMNRSNKPYLEYNSKNAAGERSNPPVPISQVFNTDVTTLMLAGAKDDAGAITAIRPPALGEANTGETSGYAIQLKQEQSQVSGFKFIDNLSDSLEYLGKIILKAIPFVIDEETTVSIKSKETEEMVDINISTQPDVDFNNLDMAVETNINLSNETRRQQAVRSLYGLMQLNPEIMVPLVSSKYLELQDFEGSDDIARIIKEKFGVDENNSQHEAQLEELQRQHELEIEQIKYEAQIQLQQKDKALMDNQILISNAESEYNILNNKNELMKIKHDAEKANDVVNNAIKMIDTLMKSGYDIRSEQVSHFFNIAYGISTYSAENVGNVGNVQLGDELIIPGINDAVTRSNEEEQYRNELLGLNDLIDELGIEQSIDPTEGPVRTTLGSY